MEQRSNDAAVKDAQIKHRKEECAGSMVRRRDDKAVKEIKPNEVECAGGTGHTIITMRILLHLDIHTDQHTMKRL
jgi:hypothetical protein